MNDHLRHIEELATKALSSVNFAEPPVPIDEIAKKMGLDVIEFDFPETLSGVLRKERGVIGVNKNHPLVRRRFTVAHELGHFLLGHEQDSIDESLDRPLPLEREANTFASYLLIPKGPIEKSVEKMGPDLRSLSKQYLVSEQALTIRLLGLNLIK